jgi:hypothetical protein
MLALDHGTNIILNWSSVSGQLYNVSSSTNLLSGSWSNLNISPYAGDYGGQNQCTVRVDVTPPQMYFRITAP